MVRWRDGMLSHEGLDAERVRELESHLREAMAGLESRGLSPEESFLVSRRRLGTVDQVAAEYAHNEPLRAWRRRAFWMTAGLLFGEVLMAAAQSASAVWSGLLFHYFGQRSVFWVAISVGMSLLSASLAVFALWWISRGGVDSVARWMAGRYRDGRKRVQDLVLLFLGCVALKFSAVLVPFLSTLTGVAGSHSWQFPGCWLVFLHTAPQVLPGVLLMFLAPVPRPAEPITD